MSASPEMHGKIEAYIIGEIQLDTAIKLYNEKNYICAITLARAAEEYLGKLLEYSKGIEPAHKALRNLVEEKIGQKIDLNHIANGFKHFDEDFFEKEYRINFEAIQLIARGVSNYAVLVDRLTPTMQNFYNNHQQSDIEAMLKSAGL